MWFWRWITTNGNSLSAIAALLACFVAFVTFRSQRQHNRLSFRPLAQIDVRDGESRLLVQLVNNGTGPLIIKRLSVWKSGEFVSGSLIDALNEVQGTFEDFVWTVDGRSVPAGGCLVLVDFKPQGMNASKDRTAFRRALAPLEVRVEYVDIYNIRHPICIRDLRWFGRMLDT